MAGPVAPSRRLRTVTSSGANLPRPGTVLLGLVAVGGCSELPARDRLAPVTDVAITSTDFAFALPDTIPAGLTRIRLSNGGKEHHHAQLARLHPGHTVAELRDTLASGALPSWVAFVGGPGVPAPAQPSEVIVPLEAGSYAVLCFVESADRVPHFAKGMIREITVVPTTAPVQPEPAVDARLVLEDYSYSLSPALAAGRRTVRVENSGPQLHEVEFVRLQPGKTAADVLAWFKSKEGPPPGEAFGGTAALQPGAVNFVTADFTRGDYALLCFVPDAGDGRRHVAHGMVAQIRVN
jgi:hypothetical protein